MNNEVKNGIIITITVILVLAIVYLVTAVFMTGEIGSKNVKEENNENTTSDESTGLSSLYDNMIIAGRVFEQKDDKYMVIFFSEKDASDSLKTAISSYDSTSDAIKLYKVNTDEKINSYVIADNSNSAATSDDELKINDVTLITIEGKLITSYVTGENSIIDKLK